MTLAKLIPALVKAQKEMSPVYKDATNPHFRSKYADLAGVVEAVSDALQANGLVVVSTFSYKNETALLYTTLYHESGEYIESVYPLLVKDPTDPQKLGAAITYARRYTLMAILGIAPEDDDGNYASGKTPTHQPTYKAAAAPANAPASATSDAPSDAQKGKIAKLVKDKLGSGDVAELWDALKPYTNKTAKTMKKRDASALIDVLSELPDFRTPAPDVPGV